MLGVVGIVTVGSKGAVTIQDDTEIDGIGECGVCWNDCGRRKSARESHAIA